MKAEIIAIGTELLLGQIVNSNAQFISEQLAALGIPVYYHSVVGDNPARLLAQLEVSTARSDLLIFTGGLGPTQDDLSRETIASFLGKGLVLDAAGLAKIARFFEARKLEMTENNQRQAQVIEGARVFPNETGMALGMAVAHEQKHFLLFPGPPSELKPMFLKHATAYLREILPERKVVYSKVMRFCGIGESALETALQDLIDQQSNPTIAPLAKSGEVTLRLTSYADHIQKAEQDMQALLAEITSRVGDYLYGWDNEGLEQVCIRLLREKSLTLSVAESMTGGLLGSYLSSVGGASAVFSGGVICYSNQSKIEQVGVPSSVLETAGAISAQCAHHLAAGIKQRLGTTIGLSITGVAGPDLQENKPVGTVFLGLALPNKTVVKELQLAGAADRQGIRIRATKLALFYLINEIKKGE